MSKVRHISTAPAKTGGIITKKLAPTNSNLLVLTIKAKIEENLEPEQYDVSTFISGAEYYFASGVLTSTRQEKNDFKECLIYIGNLLSSLEKKQGYFTRITQTEHEKLNLLQRFYQTYIIFLIKGDCPMNKLNMRRSLNDLINANPNIAIYKKLKKYNKYILLAIEVQNLDEDLNLAIEYLEEPLDELLPNNEDGLLLDNEDNNPPPVV